MPTPLSQSETLERLHSLEGQLAEVLATIHSQNGHTRTTYGQTPTPSSHGRNRRPSPSHNALSSNPNLPSTSEVRRITQLYLTYCNNQPLPLFSHASLMNSISSRSEALVFSIIAYALRFDRTTHGMNEVMQSIAKCVSAAGTSIMQKILSGSADLATLQSLCILSLLEFNSMWYIESLIRYADCPAQMGTLINPASTVR